VSFVIASPVRLVRLESEGISTHESRDALVAYSMNLTNVLSIPFRNKKQSNFYSFPLERAVVRMQ
jgi:hypothetical protein